MQLITSHLNTDFDSLASMIAVRKLYPDAMICPPAPWAARFGTSWRTTGTSGSF